MKWVCLVDKRVIWEERARSPRSEVFKWPPDYQLFGGEQRGRRAAAAGPETSFGRQVDQTFAKMQAPKNIAFFCAPSGLVVWAGLGDDRSAPSEPVSALSFLVPFYRFDSLLVCLLVDGFLIIWVETKSICALLKMLVDVGLVCSFFSFYWTPTLEFVFLSNYNYL